MTEAGADPRDATSHGYECAPSEREYRHNATALEQAERAVMHPEADDPEWRYYFGAWHS